VPQVACIVCFSALCFANLKYQPCRDIWYINHYKGYSYALVTWLAVSYSYGIISVKVLEKIPRVKDSAAIEVAGIPTWRLCVYIGSGVLVLTAVTIHVIRKLQEVKNARLERVQRMELSKKGDSLKDRLITSRVNEMVDFSDPSSSTAERETNNNKDDNNNNTSSAIHMIKNPMYATNGEDPPSEQTMPNEFKLPVHMDGGQSHRTHSGSLMMKMGSLLRIGKTSNASVNNVMDSEEEEEEGGSRVRAPSLGHRPDATLSGSVMENTEVEFVRHASVSD